MLKLLHALGENWKIRLNKGEISNSKLITDNNFGQTGLIKKLILSIKEDGQNSFSSCLKDNELLFEIHFITKCESCSVLLDLLWWIAEGVRKSRQSL